MTNSARIKLTDLSELDIAELSNALSDDEMEVARPVATDNAHGELGTATALLLITPSILSVVALWIAGRNYRVSDEYTLEEVTPQGAEKRISIKINRSLREPPETQAIEQLSQHLKIEIPRDLP